MRFSPQILDEIRERTSLSTLIGQTVKLTRAGREHKACCPFHNEKSPSFYVNDDKGFYHCFGCSAHGDAIRWLTDHRGLDFVDAVKDLAGRAGVDLPVYSPGEGERRDDRAPLYDIMERAATWFARKLNSEAGAEARAYLERRGISSHQAATFRLGFAPASRSRQPSLLASDAFSDIDIEKLVTLGLVRAREDGPHYDYFRNRLMIPICDARGRVVGFGGRSIGADEPKYLNSPDTPLFDKGRSLFNMHRAAPAARKAKRLVIVEGYLDVIGLDRVGIEEVVATNGTALTEAQMVLAWRQADEPLCCFDGDRAGYGAAAKAAIRSLPGLEAGKSLRFAFPPAGKDPDDIARESGAIGVARMLDAPTPLIDVLWTHESNIGGIETPEKRAGLRKRLAEHGGAIADPRVRDEYMRDFHRRLEAINAPTAPTQRAGRRTAFEPPVSPAAKSVARRGNRERVESAVLAGLLLHPRTLPELVEQIGVVKFGEDMSPLASALITIAYADGGAVEALDTEISRLGVRDIAEHCRAALHLPYAFLRASCPNPSAALSAALDGLARR